MRRILDGVRGLARDLAGAWNVFWFTPEDPTTLGLIRLLTGLMLLYTHFVWGLDLEAFFGPTGWLSEEAVGEFQRDQAVFSYLWLVPPGWLGAAHLVALVVLFLFTIGLLTRVTSALALLIVISYVNRVPAALFGLDQINGLLTLYLAIGPSGSALSLDRLVARYRAARRSLAGGTDGVPGMGAVPSVGANLAVRLIQVHMCVIYLFAALSKLQGLGWWDGTAIWMAAASYEYQSADLTWLAYHPHIIDLVTHVCLFWELSFAALVWPRLTRPPVLVGAVLLHLGIGLFMGMITFGLVMLIGCVSFVPARVVRRLVRRAAGPRAPLTVVYDGACGLCQRSAGWVRAFDVSGRVRMVDLNRVDPARVHPSLTREACLAAMQVVEELGDQPPVSGYWGFKLLALRLRLLWPVAWLFLLPGSGVVGPALYRVVARNRGRLLACGSGACSVHTPRDPSGPTGSPTEPIELGR